MAFSSSRMAFMSMVTQFDQLAIGHSLPDSFLLTKQKKTAITPMSNYGFILVLITFQVV